MFSLIYLIRENKLKVCVFRRYISVLYITGDKAKENYAPLTPYMNFKTRLGDPNGLQQNITYRGLNIDLKLLVKKYENYFKLQQKKIAVEKRREEITNQIKQLDKTADESKVEELKAQAIAVRTELKALKESIYPVEDDFINQFLNLPNELHEKCPKGFKGEETLLYRNGIPRTEDVVEQSHLSRTDLVHFIDRGCYYLLDEAAHFELDCTHLCRDLFVNNNYVSMSNPDFTRKVLMEANLTPQTQYHEVHEEDQRNHLNSAFLTGGGSFESFLGHLAKLSVYPSVLPLRLVSSGRQYQVKENDSANLGLYAATQANVVQTLVACRTLEEADREMDNILNLAVDFYKKFELTFRIVYVNALALSRTESLRASIQVYSPAYSRYIEVGHVSNYLEFISERILFNTKDKKNTKFLHLVGGPIVTSTVLIAALIENRLPLNVSWESNQTSQAEVFKNLFK